MTMTTMTMRTRETLSRAALVVALAGTALAIPGTASAQEQVGCFRGKPMPECKTFWIVEMQALTPMVQTKRTVTSGGEGYGYEYAYPIDAFGDAVEWNVGHMVNVGGRYAVGGVLTVGSGGPDALTGARVRGRKWLGRNVSVELEAGLLRSDAGGTRYGGASGWTSDVRLNIRDQGSFFVRYDGVSLPEATYPYNDYFDPGGAQHGVSVGASAGSFPALVATAALGAFYAVLIALIGID